MGRLYINNNGQTTVFSSGEDISSLSAITNTYFVGVNVNSGVYEKLNPNGSVVNLESQPVNEVDYSTISSLIACSFNTAKS